MFQDLVSAPRRWPPNNDNVLWRCVKQSLEVAHQETAAISNDKLRELFREISVVTDKGDVGVIGALQPS